MNIHKRMLAAVLFLFLTMVTPAQALTMGQFASVCEEANMGCSEHPLLQAYVGGALDLIAMLDEETDYLTDVYCKPTDELFNVQTIIKYMESKQAEYANKNAMLVVILYFEEHGGC